ncbi:hypothetical protein JOF56_005533 [Kibdelosporangium banguiense]|uniref:SAF domain-containing protein n=1 Tax=Kibdelosporangium banguiense TaxID=1365924 RepID=A0ABS4TMJ8_9PSEU|nr:hypothetical protein [Kibdelosporangium banguiense]MBP2325148.1 hypothetical protein [Kibdelosporangium banguiense]
MAAARAGRLVLLMLAAVLMAVGISVSPHAIVSAPSDESKDATIQHEVVVSAIPPGRVMGRPVADPTLLKVQSSAEFTLQPSAGPMLARLGVVHEDGPQVTREAQLPATGNRAPPV